MKINDSFKCDIDLQKIAIMFKIKSNDQLDDLNDLLKFLKWSTFAVNGLTVRPHER